MKSIAYIGNIWFKEKYMKDIPKINEIRDKILTDIKNKLYTNKAGIPMLQRSVWVVIATAFAGGLRACYEYSRYQYRQIFTSTADINSLKLRGEQYGLFQKKGGYSIIEIEFTGEAESFIPMNTQFTANGFIYTSDNNYDVDENGKIIFMATATTIGDYTALPLGTKINIVSPVAGVSDSGSLTSVIKIGSNDENIEDYRNRITIFERAKPQGGAIPDFVNWCLNVGGINRAFVLTPKIDNRTVTVYPLTDGSGGTRIPNDEKIAEVLAYLTDPVRLPPCDVIVKKVNEISISVAVSSLNPDNEATKQLIEIGWAKMINAKYPLQYKYQTDVNNLISTSIFSSEALLCGAKAIELTIKLSNSGGIPYVLKIGEIAKLGAITWT